MSDQDDQDLTIKLLRERNAELERQLAEAKRIIAELDRDIQNIYAATQGQ